VAIARQARVVRARDVGGATRLVELELAEPLGFVGGQYVIVDSGRTLPSGKAAKRAYSILSSDEEQGRIELAVLRIPGGAVSGFVHEIEPGLEIRLSGPWGKLGLAPRENGPILVLATDTGITAALGLVRSRRFAPLLDRSEVVWLREDGGDFLGDELVRERLGAACPLAIDALPPVDHPERVAHTRALLRRRLGRGPLAQALLAGDGAVNYALLDDLVAAGVPTTRDDVESFFNMPKKAAA
jgi:ferredoxin-NADP reductase